MTEGFVCFLHVFLTIKPEEQNKFLLKDGLGIPPFILKIRTHTHTSYVYIYIIYIYNTHIYAYAYI